jgi:hypothetical protein
MRNKRIIKTGIFFFIVFGLASCKTYYIPKENFAVIQAELDNKPVIGSINLAYKDYNLKAKYPWCLQIAIALDLENLYDNGLPKDEESKIAYKLENELLAEIQKIATAHYIGHLFNDTFLDVYIYLDNPEKVHQYLQTQINKEGLIRGFGYEIHQDRKWKIVKNFFR